MFFGKRPTQGIGNTAKISEAKYSINITRSGKKFCLDLHYNESNGFLYANDMKIYQFKATYSEIKPYLLCLANNSKDLTVDNIKN